MTSPRQEITIPVIAEEVRIGKRRVPSERVRIHRRTITEDRVVDVPLRRDRIEVERRSVDQLVDEPPGTRREGDTLIIPIVEEELEIRKRYRIREELHVRTISEPTHDQRNTQLRRQEVEVERVVPDGNAPINHEHELATSPGPIKENTIMSKSVIALYRDDSHAQQAVRDLQQHGFNADAIELAEWPKKKPDNVIDDLETRNVPHDRAELYAEAVRRGAALVVADTDDEASREAAEVLDAHEPIDVDKSAERWRTAGWQGFQPGAEPYEAAAREREREHLGDETFDVVEEEVHVGKREVAQRIRVRSMVTERPITEDVKLREEKIEVTREPADTTLPRTAADAAFKEGEVVVTATREEPVIEKEAHVVEHVRVSKDAESHTEHIAETERRRDVVVEPIERGSTEGKPKR